MALGGERYEEHAAQDSNAYGQRRQHLPRLYRR